MISTVPCKCQETLELPVAKHDPVGLVEILHSDGIRTPLSRLPAG